MSRRRKLDAYTLDQVLKHLQRNRDEEAHETRLWLYLLKRGAALRDYTIDPVKQPPSITPEQVQVIAEILPTLETFQHRVRRDYPDCAYKTALIREIRAWESRYLAMFNECPCRWPEYVKEDTDDSE